MIVKVNVAGHVPKGFAVRTRIDDCFFTANATAKALADAEKDPAVVSVAKARLLRRID